MLCKPCALIFSFLDIEECSNLPPALNGFQDIRGCNGAVTTSKEPSQTYCEGRTYSSSPQSVMIRYPWYKKCCYFDGKYCRPKLDCTIKRNSVNAYTNPHFPLGCPGALTTDGAPSEKYCDGDSFEEEGRYPWYKNCCFWDGVSCQSKEGVQVDKIKEYFL